MEEWDTYANIYGSRDLSNYRRIVLLAAIYKIWDTVIANRLLPIMNLLTIELQREY